MSATNREKRKRAKRKARERKKAPPPSPGMRAARFFKWDAAYYESVSAWERRELMRIYDEALEDRRNARRPDLYDALKAGGWAVEPRRTYLRFGDAPADGKSMRWGPTNANGRYERGVSVFSARTTSEGHVLLNLDNPLQFTLTSMIALSGRPAYLLRGRVCGKGTSGEPLLRDVDYLEPLPNDCLVATKTPSRIVEGWNERRIGGPLEDLIAHHEARAEKLGNPEEGA